MKKLFIMIAAGALLLSNCNLLYAVDFTPETFLNIRNTLSSYSGVSYDYDTNNIASCDSNDTPVNPVRGCIRYPIRQEAGDFVVDGESLDYVPKNVQVKKMILPTNKEGEFQIALLVRGKNNGQVSSNQKICSVVVFDKSSSMGFMSGGKVYTGDKWNAAVSGAMEFSNFIMSNNSNSELGLVFFSQTGYVKQTLSNTGFKQSDFDEASTKLQGWTNIHDGLIKAGEMFEGHDCDKKFIILMSDGLSNQRMVKDGDGNRILFTSEDENDERDTTKASAAATGEALNLKNQSIEIFSIGYDMGNVSNPVLAVNTLKDIASEPEESHYKDATTEDIEEIYRIIGGNLIEVGASILISLKDFLGNNILGDDINITEESNITSSGVVYSFPIRINPSATGWNESNDGLVLNYLDASGNPDSLEIPKSKTSQIYWEQPKCEGGYPSGNNIVTGNDTFTQTWVIPTPSNRGTDESQNNSLELSPIFMDWHYTDSENPGECEWTCAPGYHKQGEGCEKDRYIVIFDANGGTGTMEPQVINNGEATHLSKNTFTKTGYTFSGWNDDPKPESGTRYADEEEVTDLVGTGGSITLYARWSPNPYTIKFDKNGGSGTMDDQDMTYDTYANLHKNTYTRDGYTFSGWNTEPNGSGTPYTDEKSVKNLATTGTVTLYAQWTAITNTTYTVTFNPTDGTGTMEPQVINNGEATHLSKNTFTKTGYTFSGWSDDPKPELGIRYADEQEVTDLVGEGESIMLFAQWTANPYTIEFNANGGNGTMSGQDMIYDTPANLHKNTYTRDGYTFSGWNTEPDGSGTPYIDEESVNNLATTGTVTLYAQWTAIINTTYTVTFDANGGIGTMSSQNINSNEATHLSKNTFTRTGYSFSGWNTDENGHGTGYTDEAVVTNLTGAGGSITLYARWSPNPYTIKFDKNGGSGTMDDQDMSYDTYDNLKENTYTRDEYTFKGWNTEPDGSGTPYTDKAYVNNLATSGTITLYAQRGKKNTGGASGGGGGGGGKITKDDCPDGDYSGNFYDKKCGSKVNTGKIEEESKENQVKPTTVEYKTDTKKCSIEGSKHSAEVNEAYIWACQNGIIKSQTIQGARLGEFLNRAEMAKIITIFEMLILDSKPNRNKDCSAFADSISGYNEEMKNYMITSCQLERMGIHTADHKPIKDFMPKKFVSRAEFGTILSRTLWGNKYEAIKNSANYYVEHLSTLKGGKILSNINPELKERRSYAILMIYRAAKYSGKA